MKGDGENASDGLHSSKRLRLSIPRGRSRSLSDSAGASTSSFPANLPSVGAIAHVSEPSIEAGLPLIWSLPTFRNAFLETSKLNNNLHYWQ